MADGVFFFFFSNCGLIFMFPNEVARALAFFVDSRSIIGMILKAISRI